MNDSEILDAEYRAFIKALHPATVDTLVAVDTFWTKLYPSVVRVAEQDPEDGHGPDPLDLSETDLYGEWRYTIQPKLLTPVAGHPDPDVRNAAELLDRRLLNALFYMNPTHAARQEGEEVTVALDRGHDGLTELRRAIYHAPFRISRPEPDYTGRPIRREPLASVVVRESRRTRG
ncbi:hypothetical protein [Nocardia africana]|uniref:Uncharacterized protein n=1 Tax=Nocardia africana TaxID=134964 RepID=A0ABW6NCM1_9NOCA